MIPLKNSNWAKGLLPNFHRVRNNSTHAMFFAYKYLLTSKTIRLANYKIKYEGNFKNSQSVECFTKVDQNTKNIKKCFPIDLLKNV